MKHVSATAALLLAVAAAGSHAQSLCASDGQPRPTGLLERFINADCGSCWSDARVPRPGRGEVALDWIIPGNRGDDAPLSAAAHREGLDRLQALARPAPAQSGVQRRTLRSPVGQLRVAQGPAFNDYIGALIELHRAGQRPWQAWLLLVETIPAGTDGTPLERNLVRNVLQLDWPAGAAGKAERLFESRPMNIPAGTQPARLRIVGWIEDPRGRIRAIAQTRCGPR